MWIVNQSKTKIINTDNVVGVHVSGRQVRCRALGIEESIVLGEYDDVETCKNIVASILLCVCSGKVSYITMPTNDTLDTFLTQATHYLN